jgi:hypothetical protein
MRRKLATFWGTWVVSSGIACHLDTAHEKCGNPLPVKGFPTFYQVAGAGIEPARRFPSTGF